MPAQLWLSALLALVMLAVTTTLHYEGLQVVARLGGGRIARLGIVLAITAIVLLHLVQIGLYAASYAGADQLMHLGTLRGMAHPGALDYFYFAAETYSTLGYGDVVPTGALRLVAGIEPLNGLLLLSWSGAFLFRLLEQRNPMPAAFTSARAGRNPG